MKIIQSYFYHEDVCKMQSANFLYDCSYASLSGSLVQQSYVMFYTAHIHGLIFVQHIHSRASVCYKNKHLTSQNWHFWCGRSVDLGCVSIFIISTENLQCTLRIL